MSDSNQIDCAWLALDDNGQLAVMITAGEGPIPATVLSNDVTQIEDSLLRLPIIGDARLVSWVPDPTSFVDLSRRGFFVYDWTDVHRVGADLKQAYELVCSPETSISHDELPMELRELAFRMSAIFGSSFVTVD